ncbi:tryptophanase [Fusarium sporotrichioides]|uniref:Tryptophanase n=1 Tax=Fusarium sporotrichioides TaxID=5514 RepID=A0A395RSW2_FUSSP|nr:tryptophanase [Fusarium sporotrichioides]
MSQVTLQTSIPSFTIGSVHKKAEVSKEFRERSAIMQGDESNGRNMGYYYFLEALCDVFERGEQNAYALHKGLLDLNALEPLERFLQEKDGGFVNRGLAQMTRPNCFIVPQSRCAESVLFQATAEVFVASSQHLPLIISNGFFDTTSANTTAANIIP